MKPPKWLRKFGWNSWGPIAFTRLIRFEVYQENKWEKENNPSGVMPKDDILCSFNSQCWIVTLFPSSKAKRSFCNARYLLSFCTRWHERLTFPHTSRLLKRFADAIWTVYPRFRPRGKNKKVPITHIFEGPVCVCSGWLFATDRKSIIAKPVSLRFPASFFILFYFVSPRVFTAPSGISCG